MRIPPYGFTEPVIALSTDELANLGVPRPILQTLSAKLAGGRKKVPAITARATSLKECATWTA
jgi:hypothetical protein